MCGWAVGKGKRMELRCEADKFNHVCQFELGKTGICGRVQCVLGIHDRGERNGWIES